MNPSAETSSSRNCVLLVEDDLPFSAMLARALDDAGYAVVTAGNGREALQSNAYTEASVAVVDVIMPEMDGIETLRALRRLSPTLPVVMISGGGRLTADCYLPAARRLGAAAVLEKPFRPGILVDLIAQILGPTASDGAVPRPE